MSIKPIPEGYSNVIPFLNCTVAQKVIEFAEKTFDAKLIDIAKSDEGIILHAALKIRDSAVMLADASDKFPARESILYYYVENADEVYAKGLTAGGISVQEPTDMFYGDRAGCLKDPSGNQWWIATHIKDYQP